LVFTNGLRQDFVRQHESRAHGGIGHVILAEANGNGIHACSIAKTVVELPLADLLNGPLYLRGIYRLSAAWYESFPSPLS
jgi:hypothetical protein